MTIAQLQFDPTIQFSDVAVLLTVVLFGWGISRHMTRMEIKVELMWEVFEKRFMSNGEREEYQEKIKSHDLRRR